MEGKHFTTKIWNEVTGEKVEVGTTVKGGTDEKQPIWYGYIRRKEYGHIPSQAMVRRPAGH
jgi:hypothetical protein